MKKEDPYDWILPERFDLMAKIIYAIQDKLKVKSKFHIQLYKQHIKVFNGGWEYPGTKTQLDEFEFCFKEVLKSISERQFDPSISVIPMGKNNIPINGLHRIAASIVYQTPIYIQPKYNRNGTIYDFKWFRNYKTHVAKGLEEKWSDPMALQYARLKSEKTRILIVFPSASLTKHELLEEKIKEVNKIVYSKKIQLNARGLMNLIIECYYGEKWLGNNYERANGKFKLCLGKTSNSPIYVYLIEPIDIGLIPLFKKQARQLFISGQDALHINDTGEETLRLAKSLFNDNSIHYLNHAKQRTEFVKWKKNRNLFYMYKLWIEKNDIEEQESFAIDGSFVMALYGLREAADLDFIHFKPEIIKSELPPLIHSHNNEIKKFQDKHLHDLLFDPANYFYVHGVKCVTLDLLKKMKNIRNEAKDRMDCLLINSL